MVVWWLQNAQDIPFLKVRHYNNTLLLGLTRHSIVPNPLGVVGVLSAFNFPVAVYGWYIHSTQFLNVKLSWEIQEFGTFYGSG